MRNKTKSYQVLALTIAMGLVSQNSNAGSASAINTPTPFDLKKGHLVIQGGGFWSSQGKNQAINILYLSGNQYTVNNRNPGNGLFGLGYYLDGFNKSRWDLAYGLNAFYLGSTSVSGTIVQEQLYTNLMYSYKTQNIPLYVAAKAKIKTNNEKYNVMIDVGIGPNFMRVSQYNETPLTSYSQPYNNFTAHNNVAFSATAGIGLRLNNVFGKTPLECGYRFFYLGQGQLAINNNQYLNALKTGDTFANAIVCAVTI